MEEFSEYWAVFEEHTYPERGDGVSTAIANDGNIYWHKDDDKFKRLTNEEALEFDAWYCATSQGVQPGGQGIEDTVDCDYDSDDTLCGANLPADQKEEPIQVHEQFYCGRMGESVQDDASPAPEVDSDDTPRDSETDEPISIWERGAYKNPYAYTDEEHREGVLHDYVITHQNKVYITPGDGTFLAMDEDETEEFWAWFQTEHGLYYDDLAGEEPTGTDGVMTVTDIKHTSFWGHSGIDPDGRMFVREERRVQQGREHGCAWKCWWSLSDTEVPMYITEYTGPGGTVPVPQLRLTDAKGRMWWLEDPFGPVYGSEAVEVEGVETF